MKRSIGHWSTLVNRPSAPWFNNAPPEPIIPIRFVSRVSYGRPINVPANIIPRQYFYPVCTTTEGFDRLWGGRFPFLSVTSGTVAQPSHSLSVPTPSRGQIRFLRRDAISSPSPLIRSKPRASRSYSRRTLLSASCRCVPARYPCCSSCSSTLKHGEGFWVSWANAACTRGEGQKRRRNFEGNTATSLPSLTY